ncbi:cupin domain-containing protein [Thermogemmatispora sp.]|uniref:cupin domain-containing protein n=1 Tax=Thermogemmatispora sp. TaxID=1968838 RepID=UPI001D8301BA|nr:cupin domain-containing protein [Thermogemmatispora sp.]MBX5449226.1 cupin domain-containing protein [Thermogemmatispora sp.]
MEQQEEEQVGPTQGSESGKLTSPGHFKVFDLAASATFRSEGPVTRTLWEGATARLLLLALKAGQQLHEHRTSYEALIQVLSGHLLFTLEHERISMRAGTLLHLAPHVAHSVEALQDSLFLITLIAPSAKRQAEALATALAPESAAERQQEQGGEE